MVFFFRDKSFVNIFFLLILLFVVQLHLFFEAPIVLVNTQDGFISYLLQKTIQPLPPLAKTFVYFSIIFLQAIRLNTTLNLLKMFQSKHFTVAMSYILLSGFFVEWSCISAALVANFFVIWIFSLLAKLYNLTSPKSFLFNIGLLTAITILGYHPTSMLVVITIFAVMVVRPFKMAEWFVLLIGILLPFYFLAAILFLINQWSFFVQFLPRLQLHLPVLHITSSELFAILFIIFSLLLGALFNQINKNTKNIQIRKNWSVMLLLVFLLLPVSFLYKDAGIDTAVLCMVPSAAFIANAYSYPKKLMVPNILFWATLFFLMYNNWLVIKN